MKYILLKYTIFYGLFEENGFKHKYTKICKASFKQKFLININLFYFLVMFIICLVKLRPFSIYVRLIVSLFLGSQKRVLKNTPEPSYNANRNYKKICYEVFENRKKSCLVTKMYVFNFFLETHVKMQNSCIFKSSMWKNQFAIVKNYYFVFGKIPYFYCSINTNQT